MPTPHAPTLCAPAPQGAPHLAPQRLLEKGAEVGLQYMVVTASEVLCDFAGGRLDAAGDEPVTPESTFLSASTTKILTATAVLRLVDLGAVRLGDSLSKFVPSHPYGREVTLTHLLAHTSGVPNPMPLKWLHTREEHLAFDEPLALERALRANPRRDFEPGARYGYSNLAYWLLGEVIARASGQTYGDFLQREVFARVGAPPSELAWDVPDLRRHARGHLARRSLLGFAMPHLTAREIWAPPAGRWARFAHLHMNGPAYGGAFASARGYARFLQDLLRDDSRTLSRDSKRAFFTPQVDPKGGFLPTTLGWHRGSLGGFAYLSKPGGGPGVSSNVRLYRELGLATVFLSNQTRLSEAPIQALSDLLDRDWVVQRGRARAPSSGP